MQSLYAFSFIDRMRGWRKSSFVQSLARVECVCRSCLMGLWCECWSCLCDVFGVWGGPGMEELSIHLCVVPLGSGLGPKKQLSLLLCGS